jgi:hypothetical protein
VDALNALTHDRPTACSVPGAMMLNRDCNDPATLIGRTRSSVGCETSVLSPAIIIVITNVTTASTLAVARGRLLIPLRYRYTWSLDFPPPTVRESTWVCTFEAYKHGILLNHRPRLLSPILAKLACHRRLRDLNHSSLGGVPKVSRRAKPPRTTVQPAFDPELHNCL